MTGLSARALIAAGVLGSTCRPGAALEPSSAASRVAAEGSNARERMKAARRKSRCAGFIGSLLGPYIFVCSTGTCPCRSDWAPDRSSIILCSVLGTVYSAAGTRYASPPSAASCPVDKRQPETATSVGATLVASTTCDDEGVVFLVTVQPSDWTRSAGASRRPEGHRARRTRYFLSTTLGPKSRSFSSLGMALICCRWGEHCRNCRKSSSLRVSWSSGFLQAVHGQPSHIIDIYPYICTNENAKREPGFRPISRDSAASAARTTLCVVFRAQRRTSGEEIWTTCSFRPSTDTRPAMVFDDADDVLVDGRKP